MRNRLKGFTLIELLTGIIVMLIILSVSRLDITSGGQNSKREAEKIAAYIAGLVKKSDRINASLVVDFSNANKLIASINVGQAQTLSLNTTFTYTNHLNLNNINDTTTKTWEYNRNSYRNGAKVFASGTISGYTKNGNAYLQIETPRKDKYYVVITPGKQ